MDGDNAGLMMNTHILFLLFAMMLAGYWISDMVITDHKVIINSFKSSKYLSALGFIIVGMALYYCMHDPIPTFSSFKEKVYLPVWLPFSAILFRLRCLSFSKRSLLCQS